MQRPLPIRDLPAALEGRTLVHLSDFHAGPRVDDSYLVATCRRVSALAPDFVVFTGDFVSRQASDPMSRFATALSKFPRRGAEHPLTHLARVLDHFPHGRAGTLAILGNHDYGRGWSHPDVAERVVALAERAGIHVLRNASTVVEGLQVVGIDDLWADRFDAVAAFRSADPQLPTLALSHNPDTVDLDGWGWHRGWILSGHTHGGQVKPPFLPPPILPVANRRYTAGEFALSGGRRLYISRGVGHLIRVRFNVRPEVTVFRLERGEPEGVRLAS